MCAWLARSERYDRKVVPYVWKFVLEEEKREEHFDEPCGTRSDSSGGKDSASNGDPSIEPHNTRSSRRSARRRKQPVHLPHLEKPFQSGYCPKPDRMILESVIASLALFECEQPPGRATIDLRSDSEPQRSRYAPQPAALMDSPAPSPPSWRDRLLNHQLSAQISRREDEALKKCLQTDIRERPGGSNWDRAMRAKWRRDHIQTVEERKILQTSRTPSPMIDAASPVPLDSGGVALLSRTSLEGLIRTGKLALEHLVTLRPQNDGTKKTRAN
jgi:hypothetical protein